MEGPSLVIAKEELSEFLKKKIMHAEGSAKIPIKKLKNNRLTRIFVWGKHLCLFFDGIRLRIHFLMFGSYRIDKPRENRIPKLQLSIGGSQIYFYSCAISEMPEGFEKDYDQSVDLMSSQWSAEQAFRRLRELPKKQACDVLMDQDTFAGLGNIMKNEILFNLRMHPETKIEQITPRRIKMLVKAAEDYAWQFYEWKKENILKRNWNIMRKKVCPRCGGGVRKKITGALKRWSHFCPRCQKKI